MYQLRIYTLRTAEALEDYATRHWPRHIDSLRTFDATTPGIWTDHDADSHRLIALISYPEAADPAAVTAAYMAGPGFKADMEGLTFATSPMSRKPSSTRPLLHRCRDFRQPGHRPVNRLSGERADPRMIAGPAACGGPLTVAENGHCRVSVVTFLAVPDLLSHYRQKRFLKQPN